MRILLLLLLFTTNCYRISAQVNYNPKLVTVYHLESDSLIFSIYQNILDSVLKESITPQSLVVTYMGLSDFYSIQEENIYSIKKFKTLLNKNVIDSFQKKIERKYPDINVMIVDVDSIVNSNVEKFIYQKSYHSSRLLIDLLEPIETWESLKVIYTLLHSKTLNVSKEHSDLLISACNKHITIPIKVIQKDRLGHVSFKYLMFKYGIDIVQKNVNIEYVDRKLVYDELDDK